jgi:hypothetical protein
VDKTETRVSLFPVGNRDRRHQLNACLACSTGGASFPVAAQLVSRQCLRLSGGAAITPAIWNGPLPDLGGEKVKHQLRERAIFRHGHQLQIATERLGQADVERLRLLCFLAPAWSRVCLLWGRARANRRRRSWRRRGLLRSWCWDLGGDLRAVWRGQSTSAAGGVCLGVPSVGRVGCQRHCVTWARADRDPARRRSWCCGDIGGANRRG